MEEALIHGNVEIPALLDTIPDPVSRLDRNLRYLYANRAAETIFGIKREKMIGRTRAEIGTLPAEIYRPWDQQCRAVFSSGRNATYSFECVTRNGRRRYCVRMVPEFDRTGSVAAVLSIANDVTEYRHTEEALQRSEAHRRQAQAALRRMEEDRMRLLEREQRLRLQAEGISADAQAASRMRDEFLANLSHELRTPLNAILGWTPTLQNGDTRRETVLRALAQIEQSAQAQARLIEDLLNVSDIVSGRMRLDVRPMCLVPVINAAIETLYPAINAKGIHLETAFDLDADVMSGDPGRVRQIMWNLLSNAVKFTPRQGKIRVALRRDDSHAAIAVTDSGHGIPADFLPYVFDRFRQADGSTRKPHSGLGLGLAIARHLAEMHGGTIEVYSAGAGCGATFTVRLPVAAIWVDTGKETARTEKGRIAAFARRRSLAGLRILTVDDDDNTRDMLQEALAQAGAEVLAAASARDALEKLQRFRPDVLVSDIGMPNEDGCDLLHQVRVLPRERGGATPAIALTGYARDEDRAATRDAGYQAVTTKPVNLDELLSTILDVTAARA
jgi:PAS domain S-box-containing protein